MVESLSRLAGCGPEALRRRASRPSWRLSACSSSVTYLTSNWSAPRCSCPITDSLALNYAATAFLLGLVATGLAHLLSLTTPRPRVFFGWIVGLITVAAMVVPFAFEGDLVGKIGTSVINLVIGISIASLLRSVLARTVVDTARSWQKR